ncbi:long-chain fatty acid transport protein 4-like [Haliotis rufescens]|uniref:long-chain fatty acid transport protein 4-like n=1 Tax=Haliotis rufescens TaxID=6454 RepID=UPI00201EAA1F|nr:long-chain fatty acid transport protein 4-like [Haliotis rufescens]
MQASRSAEFSFARKLSSVVRGLTGSMLRKLAAFLALGVTLSCYVGFSCCLTTVIVFLVYLLTGGHRFALVVCRTIRRDLKGLFVLMKLTLGVRYYLRKNATVPALFQNNVKKHPNRACFIYEDKTWTFKDVEKYSNSVANFFHEAGYQKGDVVSIFMESRPEYVCFWLGLSKIGVVGALINFNQRDKAFAHSLNVSQSKGLIFGGELSQAVKDVLPLLENNLSLYSSGSLATNDITPINLDQMLQKSPTYPPHYTQGSFRDKLFYVYTSGTTGLPKAAIVTHTRFYYMSTAIRHFFSISSSDVLYDTLPLYHTAGGILGIGQAFIGGVTVVIRRKFSASQFWSDCTKYNCTIAQYIGEICRYLLLQPFRPEETQHRVRLMYGNGLRPQIWADFQKRFGVKVMGEFYGATEGNCNIVNFENKVGAVGFTTRIAPFLYPVTLIRVDEDSGEPLRDRHGMCVHAQPGETGELVGKIVKGNPLREFDGYVNKKASEKKIVENVFRKGDTAFLTGDVLMMDDLGYMYFRDRTGDTFRWKGENVSTSEVEGTISNVLKLQDAVAYGVEVPGYEGRAGMAAIVDETNSINLADLNQALQRSLPPYARPVFIRLTKEVDTTGTFKLKKTDLRKEGYDPNGVKDRLYYMNAKAGMFQPITQQVYKDICDTKIRF